MTISSSSISGLSGKDDQFFGHWLRDGLMDYLFGSRKRSAFPHASAFIGLSNTIADDLTDIYEALPVADQPAFRRGCARALDSMNWTLAKDASASEFLIRLAASIRAREVLAVLAGKAFTVSGVPKIERLYDLALDFAEELSGPASPEAAEALTHIVRQLGISLGPEQARTALVGLALAAPGRLPEHVALLATPLNEAFGGDPTGDDAELVHEARTNLILDVASRVPDDVALLVASNPLVWESNNGCSAGPNHWWCRTLWDRSEAQLEGVRQRVESATFSADVKLQVSDYVARRSWTENGPHLPSAREASRHLADDLAFGDLGGLLGAHLLDDIDEYADKYEYADVYA
jgi:hypothetical protein